MSELEFPKPTKKERKQIWGVYRKNPKPKKFKKNLPVKEATIYNDDPLLQPYYPGIAKVSKELYDKVYQRANGKCEICGNKGEEIHHLVGRRRKAWDGNLKMLCIEHHKPPTGIHANNALYESEMRILQSRYFSMGYTEDEVRYLLGTKSGRLF